MKKHFPILILAGVVAALAAVSSLVSQPTTPAADTALPTPWQFQRIGQAEAGGKARTNAGVLELFGGADQARSTEDAMHFAHQVWQGDGVFVARVLDPGGTNNKAAAGLMVRESTEPGAPNVFLNLSRSNGVSFQHRAQAQKMTEAETTDTWPVPDGRPQLALARLSRTWTNTVAAPALSAPCWLSLVRRADVFSAYISPDGANWHWVGTESVRMKSQVQVGLALGGLRGNRTLPARFDQLTFRSALPAATVPVVGNGDGIFITLPEEVASKPIEYPTVDFDWGNQKAGIKSLSAQADLQAQFTETYSLEAVHNGAIRLWVNDQLMLEGAATGPARKARLLLPLEAGAKYGIRLEYAAGEGHKLLKLMWSSPSTPRQVIPRSQWFGREPLPVLAPGTTTAERGDGVLSATNPSALAFLQQSDRLPGSSAPWLCRVIGETNAGGVEVSGDAFRVWGMGKLGRRGSDRARYVYQPWQGDVEIVAHVVNTYNGTEWAKAGLMIRDNLKEDGLAVVLANTPQGQARLFCRTEPGGLLDNAGPAGVQQPWLKLVRRGALIAAYTSPDSQSWTWLSSVNLPLATDVFVGLTAGTVAKSPDLPDAVFDSVRVTAPQGPAAVIGTGDGLRGTYCDLQTSNSVARLDPQVNFAWGGYVPVKKFGRSGFTARWEGLVEAQYSEPYVFYVKQHGTMQLWLDGKPVLNDTSEQFARERKVQMMLQAGHRYAIRLDYSIKTNQNPTAQLLWSSPNTPKEPIPQSQLYSPTNSAYAEIPDKDLDGMPDNWELANGLDPLDGRDAALDPDNDGLTNLREYQAGTNPHNPDTDNDRLPDGWEVRHRLNPFNPADAIRDNDHDGLSNLEEFQAGTNPTLADTDGDGLYDGVELKELGTDPLASDIQNIVTVAEVPGASAATNRMGRWAEAGSSLYALDNRGCVEYALTAPQADMYRLEIAGASRYPTNDANREFELMVWVDGEYLGRPVLTASGDGSGAVHQLMPWLKAGEHRVRIYWDNVVWNRSFALAAVRLQQLQGPDADGDGVKNWVGKRLQFLCGVDTGQHVSTISPACIEGRGGFLSMMTVSGGVIPQPGAGNRWFANVPLSPTNVTTLLCSFQNDGLQTTNRIVWQPTDLLTAPNQTLRVGDALLLTAAADTNRGQVQIQVTGVTNYVTTPRRPVVHAFNQAGVFTVTGTYQPADSGATQTRSISVKVVSASFDTAPAAWTAKWRPWTCTNLPAELVLESAAPLQLQEDTAFVDSRRFFLGTEEPETHYAVARLGTNGSVIANQAVEGFRLYSSHETIVQRLQTYEDGSDLVEMRLVLSPVRTNVTVNVRIIVGGVIFEDGTVEKNLTAADFNELGQAKVRFIRPASARTSVCHQTRAHQGSVLLGIFQ